MDFVPHTSEDDRAMLETVGAADVAALFDAIPGDVRLDRLLDVPPALSEIELLDHLAALARRSAAADLVCFAGGGAYDHHVPSAVRALASRAEFSTSYTPYQPELSQGVLQAIFEFQSLVCELYGLDVANASLYDGASALAEAVNLAVRVTDRGRAVVAATVPPAYRAVLETYTRGIDLAIDVVPCRDDGTVGWTDVDARDAAAVVVASPSYFGTIEDVGAAAAVAHDAGALCVAVSDPTATGILEPPGALGADVAVGEGIALGNALSYGGPAVGLFATSARHVRQVPGRIAGETVDADGRRAYVLTLQAREQHIRRARATSNVCTNQTLMAIAAAVHLSWLGPDGLARLGELCLRNTAYAAGCLAEVAGCRVRFDAPRFKELVLETPVPGDELVRALAQHGILVGPALGRDYPELERCVLVAVTERRTEDDVATLVEAVEKVLAER
ncbi:MAG TPA: aminomethyl-transferring glycine dehydrogenase subunit GcvPA [Actinomycetota bacterium]|nr:aminomethyl-transferring glycine dehydrogenase subunit GcvPA [Actinomycetota bacterium]